MERTVKMEDSLYELRDDVVEEVVSAYKEWAKENPDEDSDTFWNQEMDSDGTFHELVDSSTPIYYSEIDSNFYLHSDELEEAYDDSGCYDKKPDNYKQVCIYFWLEQNAREEAQRQIEAL